MLRFEQDGQSLYPRLAEVIDGSPELQRRVRVEIYRRFGYFPTESSEHSAEYVPWFMRHDDQIEQFRIFVGDYLARSEENLRELESLQQALASDAPLDLEPSHELASLFIHSLETGTERELHVNIRNGGLITSLPDACCVEVPCAVGAGGPKPVPVGALPPQLAALNRTFLNVVELTVRAALEESRDHVYQAALLDPNTAATLTTAQTVAMCDELFAAHRDLLPAAFTAEPGDWSRPCVTPRLVAAARLTGRAPGRSRSRPPRVRGSARLRRRPAVGGPSGSASPADPAARAPRHAADHRPAPGRRAGHGVRAGLARAPAAPRHEAAQLRGRLHLAELRAQRAALRRRRRTRPPRRSPPASTAPGTPTRAGGCGSPRPRPRWSRRRRGTSRSGSSGAP